MDEQLDESGFGPSNHNEADSPESRYLGAKLSDVPIKVELANPMTYVHEQMPPILIQHGRLDSLVPVQQSIIFVEKLEKHVGHDRFEFDILEGAGHGDPLFETEENMSRVFSFLDKHLK
jgi:dipeptidyl aminopeptidase/acylaminoacyl peptidase